MSVRDNQQATISWLVGILEGEGNFETRKDRGIWLRITNTNTAIIEFCEACLKQNFVLYTTTEDKKRTTGHKRVFRIYVCGDDCKSLFRLLDLKFQCRRGEFQRAIGASETERDVTADLYWLIGIWQAEGTFYLSESHTGQIQPIMRLSNTNEKIIQKVILTTRSMGCAWHARSYVSTVKKPYTEITIQGIRRCQRFLRLTRGLWIGERDVLRTELILEFIEGRLSRPQTEPYSVRDREIYRRVKALNA